MTPRFHPLRVAEVRRETPEAVSVRFDVPPALAAEYRFLPGQHLNVRARLDGEELRRSYSICAGVDDGELRIAIKKVPGGRFSRWAVDRLRVGDVLEVMTPEGRFHTPLDPAHEKHYVAFAAGSGITPILSLAKSILAREPRARFTLVYGNRRQASVMFLETLQDLKDRYLARFVLYHVFSREPQEVELFHGRLDGARVRAFLTTLIAPETIDEAFVCGPATMIDEVQAALCAAGVPAAHVHVERFGTPALGAPAAAAPAADAAEAVIELIVDGVRRTVEFHREHGSILQAGLAAGLDLPFSCTGGMCCTCRARRLEGEVRMQKNYALEAADVAAGFVLTCQSYPLSGRVVLSFDER
ncbi:MAG: phenylacetate-CoA oxygenase/reductase subunit PaaK [Burkholderiaceae bacterium]|nr:phenylacetate-CoA oxygenase/reductase subunit PaaK [Burkholderiaceae bacterium]